MTVMSNLKAPSLKISTVEYLRQDEFQKVRKFQGNFLFLRVIGDQLCHLAPR